MKVSQVTLAHNSADPRQSGRKKIKEEEMEILIRLLAQALW